LPERRPAPDDQQSMIETLNKIDILCACALMQLSKPLVAGVTATGTAHFCTMLVGR